MEQGFGHTDLLQAKMWCKACAKKHFAEYDGVLHWSGQAELLNRSHLTDVGSTE